MKFHKIPIKWQFRVLIALAALPFILLSAYNLGNEKKKEIQQAQTLAISLARNIGIQQKFTEAYTRQILSLIGKLSELQADKPDSIVLNNLLKNVLSEIPSLRSYWQFFPTVMHLQLRCPLSHFLLPIGNIFRTLNEHGLFL